MSTLARARPPAPVRLCRLVRCRLAASGDRGSIALYLAIFATAMIAMAGLVIDGGAALATRQKAADVAEQAARAGADALSPESLRGGDPSKLQADPIAARRAADAVLTDAGASGEVTVDGGTVTVTAHIPKRAAVLSAVGVTDISQSATQSATSVHGITTSGN
jgi:Flp pilus assembly protein TadG